MPVTSAVLVSILVASFKTLKLVAKSIYPFLDLLLIVSLNSNKAVLMLQTILNPVWSLYENK